MGDTAATSLTDYGNVVADATRKLGKKGKLPKPRKDPKASLAKSVTMAKALEDEIKKLSKALKDYQETLSDAEAECDDYSKLIAKSDFNLTKGNDDDDKIINGVSYSMTKCLDNIALGCRTPRKVAAKILDAIGSADLSSF